jgi:hypothetical protein
MIIVGLKEIKILKCFVQLLEGSKTFSKMLKPCSLMKLRCTSTMILIALQKIEREVTILIQFTIFRAQMEENKLTSWISFKYSKLQRN